VNLQRRRWLIAFSSLPWPAPACAAPAPDALARLQVALARRDRLGELARQWREIEDEAGGQARRVPGLTKALEGAKDTQAESRRGVEQALAAIAPMRGAAGTQLEALAALLTATELSRQAVARVAAADVRQLPDATRAGDTAFATRRDAERSFAKLGGELRGDARGGQGAADHARRNLNDLRSRVDQLRYVAGEVVAAQAHLLDRYAVASNALGISLRLGDLADVSEPAPAPALQAVDALKATLTALSETGHAPLDGTPLASLAADDQALEDAAAAAQRLGDATAYLELVGGPGHAALAVEYRAFVAQQSEAQTVLAAARERLLRDVGDAEAVAAALAVSLATLRATLNSLTPRVAPATAEARGLAGRTATTAAALRPALEGAERKATAQWRTAYRTAYGRAPLELAAQGSGAATSAGMGVSRTSVGAQMPRDLRGHAYDFFDTWNDERENYGAYTYVLLRSASDLQQPEVRRRYGELLHVIQTQSDARDIRPEDAPALNLFCVPVVGARERSRPDLGYGAALGCQIKVRMQNGLFTRPELRARLTGSPGPFLLTLPQRIDAANASTPLLFADLSSDPADAITDLATNYMGSLLKDFPTQQTLWRPPVPQRVALSMIWFAHEAGSLIESAIPPAAAHP
jgi:hypothetical protein